MRGPVLGIAAVFVLQLGVIGYGTASRIFDAPADVSSITTAAQPLPLITDADFNEFEPDALNHERFAETETYRAAYARATRGRATTARNAGVRNFPTEFRPVTINVPSPSPYTFAAYEPQQSRTEYPLTQASDRDPVNYVASAKASSVRQKRGFFVKTLSVIKKPYDWMKAVGSKLK